MKARPVPPPCKPGAEPPRGLHGPAGLHLKVSGSRRQKSPLPAPGEHACLHTAPSAHALDFPHPSPPGVGFTAQLRFFPMSYRDQSKGGFFPLLLLPEGGRGLGFCLLCTYSLTLPLSPHRIANVCLSGSPAPFSSVCCCSEIRGFISRTLLQRDGPNLNS